MRTPHRKRRSTHPHERIWRSVLRIPRGRVSTYGTVARLSGLPGSARLVGYAMHALPPGMSIPWHRVVNARGAISLRGNAAILQRALLEAEGVRFRGALIDLARFGWTGPAGRPARGRTT